MEILFIVIGFTLIGMYFGLLIGDLIGKKYIEYLKEDRERILQKASEKLYYSQEPIFRQISIEEWRKWLNETD